MEDNKKQQEGGIPYIFSEMERTFKEFCKASDEFISKMKKTQAEIEKIKEIK